MKNIQELENPTVNNHEIEKNYRFYSSTSLTIVVENKKDDTTEYYNYKQNNYYDSCNNPVKRFLQYINKTAKAFVHFFMDPFKPVNKYEV